MDYQFQWNVIWQNWRLFLTGIWLTIQITAVATVLGLVIGMIMAGLQLLKNRVITSIIQVYIEIIRNTPFLVQLFFVYFGLPTLGIKIEAYQAALIALTINIGAYATEIVRAGIESISKGQIEAGRSLGLSGFQIFIYVILKPALMTVYPALTSQFILIMLNSAVISVISAQELAYQAKYLQSRTFRSFEIYFFVTFLYLLLAYLFRFVFRLDFQGCFWESAGELTMREFNFFEVLVALAAGNPVDDRSVADCIDRRRHSRIAAHNDAHFQKPISSRVSRFFIGFHSGHAFIDAVVYYLFRHSDLVRV